VIKLKKDLYEINQIDERIKVKKNQLSKNNNIESSNVNEVKALKNDIYEKASKTFVYNLKKLIQLETTQKKLAKKVGLSEDLLSKYKSGEAFPSIETLIYICESYNLTIDKFIGTPLSTEDIEAFIYNNEVDYNIFEEKYYVYFLVTNLDREGAIHEGIIEIKNNFSKFKILSNDSVIKCFTGKYLVEDKLIFFNLQNLNEGITYINMTKPNVNKNKYVGGLALLMLPSDANSKPCAQKILFSKKRLDREIYYNDLKQLLSFNTNGVDFGHVKISQSEDEVAYNFIRKIL